MLSYISGTRFWVLLVLHRSWISRAVVALISLPCTGILIVKPLGWSNALLLGLQCMSSSILLLPTVVSAPTLWSEILLPLIAAKCVSDPGLQLGLLIRNVGPQLWIRQWYTLVVRSNLRRAHCRMNGQRLPSEAHASHEDSAREAFERIRRKTLPKRHPRQAVPPNLWVCHCNLSACQQLGSNVRTLVSGDLLRCKKSGNDQGGFSLSDHCFAQSSTIWTLKYAGCRFLSL